MCSYMVQLLSKVAVVFLTSRSFGLTVFSASYNKQSTKFLANVYCVCIALPLPASLSTSNVSCGAKKKKGMEWVEVNSLTSRSNSQIENKMSLFQVFLNQPYSHSFYIQYIHMLLRVRVYVNYNVWNHSLPLFLSRPTR